MRPTVAAVGGVNSKQMRESEIYLHLLIMVREGFRRKRTGKIVPFCFCYIILHLPIIGRSMISVGHWGQYIILHFKLLQWHWGMGPSVKHILGVLE